MKIERVRIELWWKSHHCIANIAKSQRRNIRRTNTNLKATQSFKSQNYCDNESISIILEALKCAHFVLQFWLDKWKSYVIVDWCARCETIVQITKCWSKHFRKHINWRRDTNLTTTKSLKFQNNCDNESISFNFATLKCVHSALQFELNKWKS